MCIIVKTRKCIWVRMKCRRGRIRFRSVACGDAGGEGRYGFIRFSRCLGLRASRPFFVALR